MPTPEKKSLAPICSQTSDFPVASASSFIKRSALAAHAEPAACAPKRATSGIIEASRSVTRARHLYGHTCTRVCVHLIKASLSICQRCLVPLDSSVSAEAHGLAVYARAPVSHRYYIITRAASPGRGSSTFVSGPSTMSLNDEPFRYRTRKRKGRAVTPIISGGLFLSTVISPVTLSVPEASALTLTDFIPRVMSRDDTSWATRKHRSTLSVPLDKRGLRPL